MGLQNGGRSRQVVVIRRWSLLVSSGLTVYARKKNFIMKTNYEIKVRNYSQTQPKSSELQKNQCCCREVQTTNIWNLNKNFSSNFITQKYVRWKFWFRYNCDSSIKSKHTARFKKFHKRLLPVSVSVVNAVSSFNCCCCCKGVNPVKK